MVAHRSNITTEQKKALVELDKWEDKNTKAGTMVTWHNINITDDMAKAIKSGNMTFAEARERINPQMLFAPKVQQENEIKELASSLNKLADAITHKESDK